MAVKHIDGLIWWAPTPKLGGGWVCHKDSPEPPATPDPAVVSGEQTKSNVETARVNAALNRVNQYTPYGNLTYNQKRASSFDQAGYDKALAEYNARPTVQPGTAAVTQQQIGGNQGQGEGADGTGGYIPGTSDQIIDRGPAPTREQFTTPGSDEWESRIELSPEQQKLFDQDIRIKQELGGAAEQSLGQVRNALAKPMDTSGMSQYRDVPTGGGMVAPDASKYRTGLTGGDLQKELPNSDYAAQRTSVEDAIYSRLDPKLERDRKALDQRLANQGIMPGSEAYNEAIDENARTATDARMAAVLAGGQEQSRLAGLDLAAGNFKNSAQGQEFAQKLASMGMDNATIDKMFANELAANGQNFNQQSSAASQVAAQRKQQLDEAAALRQMPLDELTALRTGSEVRTPTFGSVPQTNVAPTNTSGNVWQAQTGQNNTYNQQVATNNANNQAAAAVAAAALSFF